jgi:hypothetical protein
VEGEMIEKAFTPQERLVLRRATERLLAWGFPPRLIAEQLGCSQSWVYSVRRAREVEHADTEEQFVSVELLLTLRDA